MKIAGINALDGQPIEVEFEKHVTAVCPVAPADGNFIAPGFIDIQVNGFAGVDYNRSKSTHAEIARSVRVLWETGVTRFYPTVITGSPQDMLAALHNLTAAQKAIAEGPAIDGFHVEGPYIGADDGPRGAHPRQWVRKPDFDEFRRWQDATDRQIRIVTVSPEWAEAPAYIERVTAEGTVVSIGHTGATAAQIADAVQAGATLSTHLGNGAHKVMQRHPNYIWDQLADDRLMADFIVDGIHLGAAFLKTAVRAKGVERCVLVTDAAAPAGAKPGRYFLGEQPVDLTEDGRVVLAGSDKLAGSALRLDHAIDNTVRMTGVSFESAVRMATVNAAKAGKVPGRANGLATGDRADFVEFRKEPEIAVTATWIGGEKVWTKK